MRPQTNGTAERFNGHIEYMVQSHHFTSGEDLEQVLLRNVDLDNLAAAAISPEGPKSHRRPQGDFTAAAIA
ncbi:hypothetical protein [Cereibacter ovatus]|uniref:hypothetical protein n=1 Tax=Cereibacter ovatus TaxID=439529 RepID=UPI0019597EB1|nr:hypothetical protein [Cereibacter ovatus]